MQDLEILDGAVDSLRAALGDRLVAVVLFGSRARGDERPGSDWDLLVIADDLPERVLERHWAMVNALPPLIRGSLSILAKTRAEFEGHLPALYLDIALDGRIVYDPDGYAVEKLATLRDIIDRAGLSRRRTPQGDFWEWHDPPRGPWAIEWDS